MNFDYRNDYLEVKLNGDLREISDTKHEQEMAVASKIMHLLNKRTYNDVEDFYNGNNNLEDFIKRNFETPLSHFGHNETPLNEEDYKNIIENIRIIAKKKQSINTEKIDSTKIDDKVFNSMEIDNTKQFIDNSNSFLSIENRMKDVQKESAQFQTVDPNKNAENTFKEIQSKQDGINPIPLSEVNPNLLNPEEKELFKSALNFQLDYHSPIKVDLTNGVMVDADGKIMKIQKGNDIVLGVPIEVEKSYQKQLVNPNTIYGN